jgi:hypothetical protein
VNLVICGLLSANSSTCNLKLNIVFERIQQFTVILGLFICDYVILWPLSISNNEVIILHISCAQSDRIRWLPLYYHVDLNPVTKQLLRNQLQFIVYFPSFFIPIISFFQEFFSKINVFQQRYANIFRASFCTKYFLLKMYKPFSISTERLHI